MTLNFAHAAYAIDGTCSGIVDFIGLLDFGQLTSE